MKEVFEEIARLPGMMAAVLIREPDELAGWCANSAISPENLRFIAATCRSIFSATADEERPSNLAAVAFGERTVVIREGGGYLFLAYLDSPTDEAVVLWLFEQVDPILALEGVFFEPMEEQA